jgi:glucose-1-phosphate thymidylyltransferase
LGDGSRLGVRFEYAEQPRPEGIAQAFIIGEKFIAGDSVCLILGDNIFYGHELSHKIDEATQLKKGARIFGYQVQDPERYGVVEFDRSGKVTSIEEKPKHPKSHWAIPGLYFYDSRVAELARALKPSARGELEITELNRVYLKAGELTVAPLGRGVAWLDTGTFDSLISSSVFVQTIEQRQGLKIACIEEIAYSKGFIDRGQLLKLAGELKNSGYGKYLERLVEDGTG